MTGQRSALLLSGSIGMGHDALAAACCDSLESQGWQTRTLDAMRLLGSRSRSVGEKVFRAMLAVPGLYDAFYYSALRTGGRLAVAADSAARRRIASRLAAHLDRHPADLVISVFATGAGAASDLVQPLPGHAARGVLHRRDAAPACGCTRTWTCTWSPPEVAELAVLRFRPDARVQVVPPPVRPAFYQARNQVQARRELGVPPGARCALLMSGAWGLGPVAAAASALGDAGVHVLAVAGNNRRLERELAGVAARQPRVRAFGFSHRIPDLMSAADLVITSSGDTCAEARTIGRPLLLLDVVQGHGRDNLQHELELGDAMVSSAAAADVTRSALAALDRAKPAAAGPARSQADWETAFQAALSAVGC